MNNKTKEYSLKEHLEKHTKKENTYCEDCKFCNPQTDWARSYKKFLK